MMRYIFSLLCFLADLSLYAQNDSVVNALEEVIVIADKNVQQNSTGYKVLTLSDSIISNNRTSFTSLIRFNSPIYMKEMVLVELVQQVLEEPVPPILQLFGMASISTL